jgi:hypothetical protein
MSQLDVILGLTALNTFAQLIACYQRWQTLREHRRSNGS